MEFLKMEHVFKPDVLDINIDEFMGKMNQASGNAFNLAVRIRMDK